MHKIGIVWTCLLYACRFHKNMKLENILVEHILELDNQNYVPYVFLSHIYVMSGRWNKIENIQKKMKVNYKRLVDTIKVSSI